MEEDDEVDQPQEGYAAHFNSTDSDIFTIDVFGETINLKQAPNNTAIGHGAVVWEAAVCFAKYMEFGSDKNLTHSKLRGKRVLELGCGPGLGGLATMMRGSKVLFTDLDAVLDVVGKPSIMSVYGSLTSRGSGEFSDLPPPQVAPLDWTHPDGLESITEDTFDYVLACDCVFSEALIPDLIRTIKNAVTPRSLVYVVHEIRDADANDLFLLKLREDFTVKAIPPSKQHPQYVHPLVQIVLAKPRRR